MIGLSGLGAGFAEPFTAMGFTIGEEGAVFMGVDEPTNSLTTLPMSVPTPELHVDIGLGAVGGRVVAETEGWGGVGVMMDGTGGMGDVGSLPLVRDAVALSETTSAGGCEGFAASTVLRGELLGVR